MPIKIPRGAQARQAKKSLARLKDKGLFGGNAAKPLTRYRINLIKRYGDVVDGTAAVVKVPRKFVSKYKDTFRTKGTKVVIPKETGEQILFSKKAGEIVGWRTTPGGKRIRKTYFGNARQNLDNLPRASDGKRIFYSVPFGRGSRIRYYTYEDVDQLRQFMLLGYGTDTRSPYMDWQDYLVIEELEPGQQSKVNPIVFG